MDFLRYRRGWKVYHRIGWDRKSLIKIYAFVYKYLLERPWIKSIIDVGAGNGIFAEVVIKGLLGWRGIKYEGIDIRPEIAQEGRRRGWNIITGDFLKLKPKRRYDLVLVVGVLQDIPVDVSMRQIIEKLLEYGDRVLIVYNHMSDSYDFYRGIKPDEIREASEGLVSSMKFWDEAVYKDGRGGKYINYFSAVELVR